ncbi:MAG: 23S rRNA (adenine(2503)-C(2))-methyltransferase RlmN [Nitrospirae bacterium]|nr:23S rRNA (adenine(2503)-C(2))-methyltransferase RlmN [Nitrospirota bacterium]
MKINIKELSKEELSAFIESLGLKPYRTEQIINWIYRRYAESFDEMTNLSKDTREQLKETAVIGNLTLLKTLESKDGTQKFLFELEDGELIESVLIPDNERLTLCISSQAGCAMSCGFCLTGNAGFKRNLKSYEVLDQVISVMRIIRDRDLSKNEKSGHHITNIVLMGMGEPLNNFNEIVSALRKITGLMKFSKRRITLSTSGIIPKILALAETGLGVNLAISLNATTDETRSMIMPINKKYPLKDLIKACRQFPLPPRSRITFEYVLISGINDSEEDAFRLVNLLKGIRSKVNLIPYNPPHIAINNHAPKSSARSSHFSRPSESDILAFKEILLNRGLMAVIRKSRGTDISAACGQLKADYTGGK